jgi:hypothetical protein
MTGLAAITIKTLNFTTDFFISSLVKKMSRLLWRDI